MIPHNELQIKRCFKKIRQNKLKKKMRELPELKYNNTNHEIKRRILQCIADSDVDIAYAVLRKDQVYPHLRNQNHIVYNYLTGSLISKIITHYNRDEPINVIIDKSLYGFHREHFNEYLLYKMMESGQNITICEDLVSIDHVDSKHNPSIQAVDFIAGAIHRKYREDDGEYYRIISNKTIIELDFFKGRQK